MKNLFLLLGILILSLDSYGQIKFSKYVKGDWKSYKVCIIPTQNSPTTEGSSVSYRIDNYGFIINLKKFLWIKKYTLVSTNGEVSYNIDRSRYITTNLPNEGIDGEIIGKIYLADLQMETGKCDCLLSESISKTYNVILYRSGNLMIWVPEIIEATDINYADIYLKSIYWIRPDIVFENTEEPQIPPNPPFPITPVYSTQKQ